VEELLGKLSLLPSHSQNTLIQPDVKGIVFSRLFKSDITEGDPIPPWEQDFALRAPLRGFI
jgi:hypothetical protein